MRPPGPPLPTVLSSLFWMRRPFRYLDFLARWGEPFTMRLVGFPPIVFVWKPETVKQVFADDGETLAAGRFNRSLAPLLGDRSVLMLDGREHMRHRKLLMPPFHGERMQRYGDAMREASDVAIDAFRAGETFSLQPVTQDITLRVILRAVFGFRDGPRFEEMMRRMKRILELGSWPPLLLPIMQKDYGPRSPWARFRRAVEDGDAYLYEEIARRRETGERSDDILSLLLDARDEDGHPMTDLELRDELTTLLVAGHETTATSLAWAVRWTLDTPGLVDRIREEVRAGGDMPLVDAVAREALRLNPVIPIVGRIVEKPTRIAGYDLPAGTPVACSIYLAHQNPDVYPEPKRFDPSRFLGKRPSPNEWYPFGGGIRRCIGMAFALYEMRVVLARLFERVDLELAPRGKTIGEERRAITLMPTDGLRVRVRGLRGQGTPTDRSHAATA